MQNYVFPTMVVIFLAMTIVGIKLGGRLTSKILFWLIFFPLIFVLTNAIRGQLIGAVNSFGKTALIIIVFSIVAGSIGAFWLYSKKKLYQFFPGSERRPAGGALAGACIGVILAIIFLFGLIALYPKQYTHFKFKIVNGFIVDIDLANFQSIHGKLEQLGAGFFGTSSGDSYTADGASHAPGGWQNPYPDSVRSVGDPDSIRIENGGRPSNGEELPIWARPPPDQSGWDMPPPVDETAITELPVPADTVTMGQNRQPAGHKRAAPNQEAGYKPVDPEKVPREGSERLK